jgi:uncharacterized protein YdiU (UPF0061 family)
VKKAKLIANLPPSWLALLEEQKVDFTLAWRRLSDAAGGDTRPLESLFSEGQTFNTWIDRWRQRSAQESIEPGVRMDEMKRVNPIYIPEITAWKRRLPQHPIATTSNYLSAWSMSSRILTWNGPDWKAMRNPRPRK